jgi:hypothetical protein
MHLSATLHVIRYTVMLWQLKCLTFLLMDLLWNTNIWRVTQTVIIIPLIYSCLFPYFVRALFMHAISGKILLEKNDYHLIVTVEMMVSGKFTGVCSLSLPLPPSCWWMWGEFKASWVSKITQNPKYFQIIL